MNAFTPAARTKPYRKQATPLWHDISTRIAIDLKFYFMQKTLGLLLAAAAAYGVYKYNKLSPDKKEEWKEKGRDFLNKKAGLGNLFSKKVGQTG